MITSHLLHHSMLGIGARWESMLWTHCQPNCILYNACVIYYILFNNVLIISEYIISGMFFFFVDILCSTENRIKQVNEVWSIK